jgi:hypothetical protein
MGEAGKWRKQSTRQSRAPSPKEMSGSGDFLDGEQIEE